MATSRRTWPFAVLIWPFLTLFLIPVLAPVSPLPAAAETVQVTTHSTVSVLHVFVAVGQSNMSGRGLPIWGSDNAVNPRMLQYGAKLRTLRPATVPLDMHDRASGISPATTFAREYLKTQPSHVGVLIIPAAHGNTRFVNAPGTLTWAVGAASAPKFDLPALAVAQARDGIAAARAAGYSVDLKGVLWHQGESNAGMSTSEYSAELDELIAYFRRRFAEPKLPFVVGRMAPEGIAAQPARIPVDVSHRQTPDRVPYTGFAPSMTGGVNEGDNVHFSRTGIEFLGKTYLAGYLRADEQLTGSSHDLLPTKTQTAQR